MLGAFGAATRHRGALPAASQKQPPSGFRRGAPLPPIRPASTRPDELHYLILHATNTMKASPWPPMNSHACCWELTLHTYKLNGTESSNVAGAHRFQFP